ncbi:MAG: helix-turn-helix domain-containing protein [Xanthomonadales bacterium]|nr:helix-turn-helix domain-containing protein [Xanthomonadales bacterium]
MLGLLLMRPEDSLHVREIARLTGVPPGSLHRELRTLTETGLLLREPVGNQVHYSANRNCPIYPELAEIFRQTTGLADLLREALAPLSKRIHSAFLFGSIARQAESSRSDVDLFVVGKASFTEVVTAVSPLQERLGREINPVVMTPEQFRAARENGERFVERVVGEPRLFLMGADDDVG